MRGNPDRNFRRLAEQGSLTYAKPRRGVGGMWKVYSFVAGVGLLVMLIAWRVVV